jgi:hypothetical protein
LQTDRDQLKWAHLLQHNANITNDVFPTLCFFVFSMHNKIQGKVLEHKLLHTKTEKEKEGQHTHTHTLRSL